jgi:hypothetical protein
VGKAETETGARRQRVEDEQVFSEKKAYENVASRTCLRVIDKEALTMREVIVTSNILRGLECRCSSSDEERVRVRRREGPRVERRFAVSYSESVDQRPATA